MHFKSALLFITLTMSGPFLARGAESCSEVFLERSQFERHKAELQKSHDIKNFVVRRNLKDYLQILGPDFARLLGKDWLDSGAGEGLATETHQKQGGKGAITIISVETNQVSRPGYRVLKGRLIEEIHESEIGPVDLITDIFGPFAYSERPDLVIAKYLSVLSNGGKIFLVTDSRAEKRGGIFLANGERLEFIDWLKQIKGIHVHSQVSVDKPKILVLTIEKDAQWIESRRRGDPEYVFPTGTLEEVFRENNFPPVRLFAEGRFDERIQNEGRTQSLLKKFKLAVLELPKKAPFNFFERIFFDSILIVRDQLKYIKGEWLQVTFEDPSLNLTPLKVLQNLKQNNLNYLATTMKGKIANFMRIKLKTDYESLPPMTVKRNLEELKGFTNVGVISDSVGPFLNSGHPDKVLREYVNAIADGGFIDIFVPGAIGNVEEYAPPRVLVFDSASGKYKSQFLEDWIRSIPGLEAHRSYGSRFLHITIQDRNQIRIPSLMLLGLIPDIRGFPEMIFVQQGPGL